MEEETKETLAISELFVSIQGEGSYIGRPCTFIRLFGCNLRCSWCDSRFSWDKKFKHEVKDMERQELLNACEEFGAKVVEITGGEPMRHGQRTVGLMNALLEEGYTVLLETNGSQDLSVVPSGVHIVMDIKCPGSGMSDKMDFDNFKHLKSTDDIKFVIAGREDYDYAKKVILDNNLGEVGNCIMGPVTPGCPPEDLAEWVIADTAELGINVFMQVQMHKTIWGNERER